MARKTIALLFSLSIPIGCAAIAGIDELEVTPSEDASPVPDGGSTSSDDTSTSTPPDSDPTPPGDAGPLSPLIKITRAEGDYSVEAYEVRQAQYQLFLRAKAGDTSGQSAECAANSSFLPQLLWDPIGIPNRPVVGIDWCDAKAYCEWAGRRLCGGLGGTRLTTAADGVSPAKSQWEFACTKGGTQPFPYGTTGDVSACVLSKGVSGHSESVGTDPKCVGGTEGLYDMVGNVSEWVDACDPDGGACAIVGGSWHSGEAPVQCNLYFLGVNYTYANDLGFRCCND